MPFIRSKALPMVRYYLKEFVSKQDIFVPVSAFTWLSRARYYLNEFVLECVKILHISAFSSLFKPNSSNQNQHLAFTRVC